MDLTELYRAAVETSPDGLWVIDLEGRTIYANPEIGRIHRVPVEHLGSLTVFDTLDEAGREQFAAHLQAVRRGELNAGQVEVQWVRSDGSVVWMLVSETAMLDEHGRPTALLHRFSDYTERRAMLDSLRASEEALADQVAQNTLMQAVTSAANQASTLLEVLVHARGLVLLHDDWERARAFVPGEDGDVVPIYASPEEAAEDDGDPFAAVERDLARRCLQTREVVWDDRRLTLVFPVLLGDRVYALLAVTSAPPLWRFELIEDIAVRVADQLARVAEREEAQAELARARDQAMEASRQKSDFLATMSHEIRTPINGVIGLNDLLLRSHLSEEQRRLATGVQIASRALLEVVNDILDFSKIEAGRLELEQVAFEVRPVLDQVAGLLAETARVKGIALTVTCDPDVPTALTGDPTRLAQVLTNLISNAVKFTEAGRVEVTTWVTAWVTEGVTGESAGGSAGGGTGRFTAADDRWVTLHLEVRDTGVGVPEDRVAALFEPFTQADTSTTRRYGGTGLGLAICREIVTAMDGELGHAANPGGGSVFTLAVPLAPADPADAVPVTTGVRPPTGADEAARQALGGRRVLVVDDGCEQTSLTDQLGWWGVLVETAGSVRGAVSRLGAEGAPTVDVVVLAMAGVQRRAAQLAEQLRAAGLRRPPVLAIASVAHADKAVGRNVDVDDLLVRPVPPGAFRSTLVRLMTGGSSRPRVLIVEDHPVNQMVAAGLLEALGYDSEVAEDGEAGVDRARGGGFDAVLMDVQMPRLDGYEATRRIRRDAGAHARVPIIAMTAAAIEGERERCLAAGMDDFLTKPVDSATLGACLDRWLRIPALAEGADVPAPPAPAEPTVLDVARLRELRELDTPSASYVDRAVGNFLTNSVRDLATMQTALGAADLDELCHVAHRLAGGALNLGAAPAGEALRTIENVIRGDVATRGAELADVLADLLATADAELARARSALRTYLGASSPAVS